MAFQDPPFEFHPAIRADELREGFDRTACVGLAPFIGEADSDDWRVCFRVGQKPQVQLERQASLH